MPSAVPLDQDLHVDAAGTAHVAWIGVWPDAVDGRPAEALLYSRAADGTGWKAAMRVGQDLAESRASPALAVDSGGAVHLVYVAARLGRTEIRHTVLEPTATGWPPSVRVDELGRRGRRSAPAIAADQLGNMHIAWVDDRNGDPDVLYRRLRADGGWDEVIAVHDPRTGDQRAPKLAADETGTIHAVWEDTRDGVSAIWASQLPPASPVWWPDFPLISGAGPGSGDGTGALKPVVAPDGAGGVHALWVGAGGGVLSTAWRAPGSTEWSAPRELHRPRFGAVLDVSAAGQAGKLALAWAESRPEGPRVYGAALDAASGLLAVSRLDGVFRLDGGHSPRVALAGRPFGLAHVAWLGRDAGQPHVLRATAPFELPAGESVTLSGWLSLDRRSHGCHADMFVLEACDGSTVGVLRDAGAGLGGLLGAHVRVRGVEATSTSCKSVLVHAIELTATDCPRTEAALEGSVLLEGSPVDGARVSTDERFAITGPSGRFFLTGVSPGVHDVVVSHPCALPRVATGVRLNSRQVVSMEVADLLAGDLDRDCRIDLADLALVAAFIKQPIHLARRCADLDGDGMVSIADLSIADRNRGAECPLPWSALGPGGSKAGR